MFARVLRSNRELLERQNPTWSNGKVYIESIKAIKAECERMLDKAEEIQNRHK